MPVCIAGMHRSGTSLAARLLYSCGLYLGPESELMNPSPDNPEGYWENIVFVNLNDRILRHWNGSWHAPPSMPEGWEFLPPAAALLPQAQELIERFDARAPWGWKDPRNTLTVPFWRRLVPRVQVLVCLRSPLEVVASMRQCNYAVNALDLWTHYNRTILRSVPAGERMITHYDAYFHDPRAELRRVLEWLNMSVTEEVLDRSVSAIALPLRRQRASMEDLLQADLPEDCLDCYLSMCAEAGPIAQSAFSAQPVVLPGETSARPVRMAPSAAVGCQDARRFFRLEARLVELQNQLEEKLGEQEGVIQELESRLKDKEQTLQNLNTQLETVTQALMGVTSSRAWRLFHHLHRLRRNLWRRIANAPLFPARWKSAAFSPEKDILVPVVNLEHGSHVGETLE